MMRVLDMTAGNRAIWFDKQCKLATYVDIRPEVNPDFVGSASFLPAEVGYEYDLVAFDPPHKPNGSQFGMARSYGSFTMEQIRALLAGAAKEAHRVTNVTAFMAFKWNDHHLKLDSALRLLEPYWYPLFGHGVSHQQRATGTSWVMLGRNHLGANE